MVNRTFGNRYQVTEKIGMGGMAEVYKATDSTLGRTVAVKVMLPQYASDPNFAARFRQEAQSAANLSSPYIVNIYDWGRDGDSYYIVMEYVRGTDLKTAIQQRGSIHPRKVAEIGSQVCSALSVAHGYDIIHRDIKSANIMVQGDGNVKVMDFGIAQAGHPGMTQDSSVLGTAHYVSPEQAQGKKLTPASDLYSLGVVLYEAATGQLPFDGPDVVSVAMKQVQELPVPPRQINPSIDPAFEAIIMTALQKNPDDRFATAKEMQRAIDDYLQGRSSAETQVLSNGYAAVAGQTVAMGGQTTVLPAQGQTTVMNPGRRPGMPPQKTNTARNAIIAVIAIILIAGIGFFVANAAGLFGGGVTVPNVVGQTEQAARSSLQSAGLKVGKIQYDISENVEKGNVISQDPQANAHVEPGSTVNLVISSGKTSNGLVPVPNLMGLTPEAAQQQLEALGLVGVAKEEYNDSTEAGKVCAQEPIVNSQVEAGSTVTYTVSKGKKTTEISSYVGSSVSTAQARLESAGFSVKINEVEDSTVSAGTVIGQIPDNGSAEPGSTITLIVAKAPAQPTTPTPGDTTGGETGGDAAGGTEGGDAGTTE